MDLAEKHRPDEIAGLINGENLERSVFSALEAGAHSFLFTGPSGCGKTTLARCLASALDADRIELDAATHGKVENTRELSKLAGQGSLVSGRTVIIFDEAHAASKGAWQALLKAVEEPAPGVYWALCTTEEDKVPKTIRTRCVHLRVSECTVTELGDLLESVAKKEKMTLATGVTQLCATEAYGSPRKALQYLSQTWTAETAEEAAEVLASPIENPAMLELGRKLVGGTTWPEAKALIYALREYPPESVRIAIIHYVLYILRTGPYSKDGEPVPDENCLAILDAFSEPFTDSVGANKLVLAVAGILLSGE